MLEMKFTPIISALPSPSGFSALISSYPTSDVIVGEAIFLHVSGVAGFADVDADLDFEWELGEPGKTPIRAIALRSNDLNKVQGRSASMAWDTAGQKTVTLTIRDKAGNTHTETHTVTVKERDAVAWTKIYYIDFGEVSGTPDFTDAPAETSVVKHVSSFTELRSEAGSARGSGARLLFLFKRGETFTRDNTGTKDPSRITVSGRSFAASIDGWGTGADAELRVDLNAFAYDWFYLKGQDHTSRIGFHRLRAIGNYDPTTGGAPNGSYYFLNVDPASGATLPTVGHISLYQCESKGLTQTVRGIGAGGTRLMYFSAMDNKVTDWHDFAFGMFGGAWNFAHCHNYIRQNALTAMDSDGKSTAYPNTVDHGCGRCHEVGWANIYNNNDASAGGWIGQAGSNAIQEAYRVYQDKAEVYPEAVLDVIGNIGYGNTFLAIGTNGTGREPRMQGLSLVVERNIFNGGRQHVLGGFLRCNGITGFTIRNNLVVRHNACTPSNMHWGILNLIPLVEGYFPTETAPADFLMRRILIENNTVVSLRDNTLPNVNRYASITGGYGGAIRAWAMVRDTNNWTHTAPTIRNNITHVPGHANWATFTDYGPLSNGDNFRPTTTSAAHGAMASGGPIRDLDGILRNGATNIGAHHTSAGSVTAVDAPINVTPPTISENPVKPGWYTVSDFGNWANLSETDKYFAMWEWEKDGVTYDVSSTTWSHDTMTDLTGQTGDFTCTITMTNASGVRVSAVSNTITLV